MDFSLNEEQRTITQLAEQFAREEIAPFADSWDKAHTFPIDTLRKAAQCGFSGMNCRANIGGSDLSRLSSTLVFETLSTACVSTSAYLSIHNMVTWLIDTFADDALRSHFCPKLCTMDLLSSYCLTEPDAGSDAASLKTQALQDGDHYVLNGSKAFISGAGAADVYLCMVRTSDHGAKGITCLLIEKETPGLSFGKLEKKLGWHSQPTRMVFLNDCRVPMRNRIGEEGQGFSIALNGLNGGRVNIGACSLGGADACLSIAKAHLLDRKQFQKSLSDFQSIQFKFAELMTELEAARLMLYRAAHSLDTNDPSAITHCAMAKRLATDTGFHIANECMQFLGGYGYLEDHPIERFFRDLRVHQILEGTNEIMKLIIARDVLSQH